jgi:rhodanese-related sulfurtransferase
MKGEIAEMLYRCGLLIIVIAIGLSGCSGDPGQQSEKSGYKNVSVDQFVQMIDNKDFILINTHIPYEGEIPGTDLLIPFNEIDQHKTELPNDKASRLVVYCKAGPMGDIAAKKLVQMGYTNVINFKDGMNALEKAGRSLHFRSQ